MSAGAEMIRILVAEHNAERREQLRAALCAGNESNLIESGLDVAGVARDGAEAIRLAHALHPDIVLAAVDLPLQGGFAVAERLTVSGLPLECVLITDADLTDALRRAMRAGAKDILSYAAEPAELRAAVRAVHADSRRRRSPAFAVEADPRSGTRVIAVSGAKGGIGKTTLAVNLAAALATDTGEPTALLDLYTQFGDAALLLNLSSHRTLADLVQIDHAELDKSLLDTHLERHDCGLRVLAGAAAPLPLDALTPACLDQLFSLLMPDFRYVVLDVPPILHAATRHALSQADTVLLVANLFDLTTLADTRLWLDAVAGSSAAPDAIQIVLNRVSASNRLQIPDITQMLGKPPHGLIPNDGKLVPASVNAGVPFVLSHPASPVGCSVFGLARSLSRSAASPNGAALIQTEITKKETPWRFPRKR